MTDEVVRLAWALIGGTLTHISEFRGVPTSRRPPAMCEACGAGVVMKVGPIRAHHYAHKPNACCPLTAPETARHYNSKHILASKLRLSEVLHVIASCSYSRASTRCQVELASIAALGWDEVRVEKFIDPVRPDILLLKKRVPILAIEVRATNPVSEAKATHFGELRLPWIEVGAGSHCDRWITGSPLRVIRYEAPGTAKLCPTHAAAVDASGQGSRTDAAETVRKARRARFPDGGLPSHGDRWKFRVVDCHPRTGSRVRKVFWVYSRPSGSRCRLRLVEDSNDQVIAELSETSRSQDALRRIHRRLGEYLIRSFECYFSPMGWQDAAVFPANPVTIYRRDYMPVKYHRGPGGAWVESSTSDV